MPKGNLFTVYKSSAGSGKTFTLTREYLKLAFQNPEHFKKILAVTFTNKATQEMKERIIQNLYEFSNDSASVMACQLKELLDFTDVDLQKKSKALLVSILHNFSRFSVQTIDRFFQNVVRSFARELSIQGDGELLLNTDEVRQSVLDLLMEDIGDPKHAALKNWVIEFSINKLEDKGRWDVRRDILSFTEELMKDDFKVIESALSRQINEYDKLKTFKAKLSKIMSQFEHTLDGFRTKAFQLIESSGLVIEDFSRGKTGALNFFNKIGSEQKEYSLEKLLNSYVKKAIESDGESLATKTSKKKELIFQTAAGGLIECFEEVINYIKQNIAQYRSAENILKNIYLLGITQHFTQRMQEYKKEEGIQFLSDTTQFLNEIIGTDPAESPFIYEKMGSFFDHFLIDEFQDTSTLQWENFKPLIENSLAEGNENLVVGDVKQSIYRWRGGDWRLLLKGLREDISSAFYREEALSHNFRSKPTVIDFNNNLFTAMPSLLKSNAVNKESNAFTEEVEYLLQDIPDAYSEVFQEKKKDYSYQGLVELQFFSQEETEEGEKISWQTKALEKFVQDLEGLQEAGLKLEDVGVLVRKKKEGIIIQDFLEHYKNENPHKLQKYQYNIISDETLLLSSAHIVNFLLNCFQYLYTEDKIALSQIKFYYQKIIEEDDSLIHEIVKVNSTDDYLPHEFLESQKELLSLSLLEMSEKLIQFFKLREIKREKAYLSAFQDVLLDFGNKGGIPDFIEWWEENNYSYAIKLQSDENSARLMTIHKSKGLEFKICMIPLLDWTLSPNHSMAPTLWVNTEATQFAEIPFLPIKQSSSLKESDFAGAYWEEEVRSYLDNMNLMYVALTRAGDALFINSHSKAKSGYISKLLLEFAQTQEGWDEANMKITFGSDSDFHLMAGEKESATKAFPVESVKLTYYESHNWHDKLKIKHSSSLLGEDAGLSKTDLGIYVHDIFSRLNDLKNLPAILAKVKTEKVLNKEDFESIQKLVQDNLREDSILLPWFDTDWQVKTEVPVLLQDGSLIRLDRVLIKGNKAKILDFKTGLKSAQDIKQVSFYRNTLMKMGYEKVSAHIAYLNPLEIIEI